LMNTFTYNLSKSIHLCLMQQGGENMDDILITLPKNINPNMSLPDPALIQIYKDRENRVIWMLDEIGEEVFDWVDFILDVNREDEKA